jgi:uncharacterized phage protein gp47/JayE
MALYDYLDKYTPQALLRSALSEVSANVDKREGSVIYDTLSPLAVLSANLISLLKIALTQTDIQGATGSWLDLVASQYFVYRRDAVASQRVIQVSPSSIELDIETALKTNDGLQLIWTVTEVLTDGRYVVTCTTAGSDGGKDYGELTPVNAIDGISSIVFIETLNEGIDEESDSDLRIRIWQTQRSSGYGGNFDDYKQWCFVDFAKNENGAAIDGMFFFPSTRYLGEGFVKILVTSQKDGEGYLPASYEVSSRLKAFLDPVGQDGLGAGVVPVGHRVHVETMGEDRFNLTAYVVLKGSSTTITEKQRAGAEQDLREYFESVRKDAITKLDDDFPPAQYTMTLYLNRIESAIYGTRFANVTSVLKDGVQLEDSIQYTVSSWSPASLPVLGTLELFVAGD